MRVNSLALHGESSGILSLMPDNTDAGYGPGYVSERGQGWVFYVADSHWPNFYWLNCASLEEAYEHASIVLCDVEEDVEAKCAALGDDYDAIDKVIYDHDCTVTADGRVRSTWALHAIDVNHRR